MNTLPKSMFFIGLAAPMPVSKGAQNKCSGWGAIVDTGSAVRAGSELEPRARCSGSHLPPHWADGSRRIARTYWTATLAGLANCRQVVDPV